MGSLSEKGNRNSSSQEDSIPESGTDFGMGSPDTSKKGRSGPSGSACRL